VFPAPFGPRKPNTWPASTARSSPARAVVPRYLLVSSRHSMAAVIPPPLFSHRTSTLGGIFVGVVSTGTSSASSFGRDGVFGRDGGAAADVGGRPGGPPRQAACVGGPWLW